MKIKCTYVHILLTWKKEWGNNRNMMRWHGNQTIIWVYEQLDLDSMGWGAVVSERKLIRKRENLVVAEPEPEPENQHPKYIQLWVRERTFLLKFYSDEWENEEEKERIYSSFLCSLSSTFFPEKKTILFSRDRPSWKITWKGENLRRRDSSALDASILCTYLSLTSVIVLFVCVCWLRDMMMVMT